MNKKMQEMYDQYKKEVQISQRSQSKYQRIGYKVEKLKIQKKKKKMKLMRMIL